MAPTDFLRVVFGSRCLIGNSSVGIRECSFLGVPTVNIGSRQAGRERGANLVDVGYSHAEILEAIEQQAQRGRAASDTVYGDGKAGVRIAELLAETPLSFEKRLTY
jgi:UDP-N-acetylglucosamine 2-epimerase